MKRDRRSSVQHASPSAALAFLMFAGFMSRSATAAPGASDLLVRAPLPPAAMPDGGGTFIDPAFGSTVIRVTDASDGRRCVHAYSYWPAFNADATRILIACDDVPMIVQFDPATGKVGWPAKLEGPAIQFEGATWSRDVPSTLYALDKAGRKLYRIDVRKGAAGFVVLKDFGARYLVPLEQLTVSEGGSVFGFSVMLGETSKTAAIWRRSDDRILEYPGPAGAVNELRVSKTGGRALVTYDDERVYLWTLSTGAVTAAPNSTSHWDLGRTLAANGDGILTGIQVRGYELAGWLAPRNVFRYLQRDGRTPNWTIAEHVSARADDETRLVVSTYAGGATVDQPFEDEIVIVRSDGGGFVRLAHTRSCECQDTRAKRYWSQPRATIDRSGRWILWTSDLGSPTRFDVLIVRAP